jgi:hypothetical protein
MFVINPPHTLKAELQAALPLLLTLLGRGRGQGQTVDSAAAEPLRPGTRVKPSLYPPRQLTDRSVG